MQNLIAVAVLLAPFLTMIMQAVKPLLPQPANPDRQDAVVRTVTGAVGLVLSLGVYFFTSAAFTRAGLGQSIAEGGIAAAMAAGLWHGVTGAVAAVGKASASATVTPSFTPIANDPLNPSAAPSPVAPTPVPAPAAS